MGNFNYYEFRQRLLKKLGKKQTGLNKPFKLSPGLAELVGLNTTTRTEIMKRLHAYVKLQDLLDPLDGRYFYPDEKMQPIFGSQRMRTFGMAKYLAKHLTPLE